MRCAVGVSRGLQQQKKGSAQLQTETKVQDSAALCHASRWERLPNKCVAFATLLHLKKQKQCTLLTPSWAGEREEGRMKGASLKKLFSPLSCAPMEQNPCQIPDEGKKSCNFLPLNMLAGGLAAQLASHKQQWHNNDSNNNSNDNNDRNYDKNHNTAAATDAVANLFFWRGALKWHNSIAITRSQMS